MSAPTLDGTNGLFTITDTAEGPAHIMKVLGGETGTREVIRISQDGKLFWNGREVETDDEFRAAMLDLAKHLWQRP